MLFPCISLFLLHAENFPELIYQDNPNILFQVILLITVLKKLKFDQISAEIFPLFIMLLFNWG